MAESATPHHQVRQTNTLRFAHWVVKRRLPVLLFLIAATTFFALPIFNTVLTGLGIGIPALPVVRVDTNARDQWPDHPFIHAQDKFASKFGSATGVAIGVVVKEGTIFTPETLAKIDRITKSIDGVEASDQLPSYDSQTDAREELRAKIEEEAEAKAARRSRRSRSSSASTASTRPTP